MAVVVSTRINAEHRLPRELLGAVVTVVTVIELVCDNLPVWQLKTPVHFVAERYYSLDGTIVQPGDEVALSRLPDSVLQPIRGVTAPSRAGAVHTKQRLDNLFMAFVKGQSPGAHPAKLFANV